MFQTKVVEKIKTHIL